MLLDANTRRRRYIEHHISQAKHGAITARIEELRAQDEEYARRACAKPITCAPGPGLRPPTSAEVKLAAARSDYAAKASAEMSRWREGKQAALRTELEKLRRQTEEAEVAVSSSVEAARVQEV